MLPKILKPKFVDDLVRLGDKSDGGYVISSSVMTPTFADIDGDYDLDFFTGNMVGTLTYYENLGFSNDPPNMEFITNSWQDIYIVGGTRTDERHGASIFVYLDITLFKHEPLVRRLDYR